MTITEIHDNIFNIRCEAIVNAVNTVGVMGGGLAFVLTKEEIYDIINGCMPGECKIDKGDFKIHCVARMALVNYATNFFIENYGEKFSKIT
jgi:hypothetical protein